MNAGSAWKHGAPLLALALAACGTPSTAPPTNASAGGQSVIENAARRDLVDVRALLPDISCGLRYATADNITGQVLYPPDMPCLLHRATAKKLAHAHDLLRQQGFGLRIWDAWRPPEVQTELFRHGEKSGRATLFVNPREAWSFHCSGTAVDLTLVDSAGREIPMPSNFDETEPLPHAVQPVSSERVLANVARLRDAMLQAGFTTIELEWWHFDDAGFKDAATCLPAVFAKELGLALPGLK